MISIFNPLYFAPLREAKGGYLFSSRPIQSGQMVTLIAQENITSLLCIGLTTQKPLTLLPQQLAADPTQLQTTMCPKNNNLCAIVSPQWEQTLIKEGDTIRIKTHSSGVLSVKHNARIVLFKHICIESTDRPLYLIVGPCTSETVLQAFDDTKYDAELALYISAGRQGPLPPSQPAKLLYKTKVVTPPPGLEKPKNSDTTSAKLICPKTSKCVICKTSSPCMITLPCCHMSTCMPCSTKLNQGPENNSKCLTCGTLVGNVFKALIDHDDGLCACKRLCVRCNTSAPTSIAKPCGHLQLCHKCTEHMKSVRRRGGHMPNCSNCKRHVAKFYSVLLV